MNSRKVIRVMKREYVESVRKKSFLFGLVATPIMMGLAICLPLLADGILGDPGVTIGVLDRTGVYGERLVAGDDEGDVTLRLVDADTTPQQLDERVSAGELTGWLLLPEDFAETGNVQYRAEAITNGTVLQNLEARAGRVLGRTKAAALGLDETQADALLTAADLKTARIGAGRNEDADFTEVYLHAVLLVMTLFFALIPTGHILLRSVIEEKSNRVIEVLLSSLTPMELMVGKILGLGAVGLTLLGTWAAVGALLSFQLGANLPVTGEEIWIFALYFLPGYFLFAALLGTIGSLCATERDAQPFLTPISLTLVLPVMLGLAIAQAPDHWIARAFSYFPPLTPSLMLFRYAIKEPPAWEIATTWLTLVLSTGAMFFVAARVFRVGILLTGKRPTFGEIARWVKVG